MSDNYVPDTPYELRPYQLEGVRFLRSSDSALLADEMGLGKTVQTAVALKLGRQEFRRVLLVAPTSLCLNWQRELETWAPELPTRRLIGSGSDRAMTYRLPIQVIVASYGQVRLDSQGFYGSLRFDLVILDEAQRIKNINSATNFACRIIQRDRSWALSGTPLENSPSDLSAIFRFVRPQLIRTSMSRSEMHKVMSRYFLRRTKAGVLDELPPILVEDIRLELGKRQRRAYDEIWDKRHGITQDADVQRSASNMLAVLTQLKQICNVDRESNESVKLDALHSFLENIEHNSEKVLIFSQYVETLKWLSREIRIPNKVFHGGLSLESRHQLLEEFRIGEGPQALLLSLQAGGVGLNLQEASSAIMFDRWWNPAVENQAIQRAHRFGRQSPLQVVRFTVEDTIEERIIEILHKKKGLFDEYVEAAPGFIEEQSHRVNLRRILEL